MKQYALDAIINSILECKDTASEHVWSAEEAEQIEEALNELKEEVYARLE
jgi:hypothetical protein